MLQLSKTAKCHSISLYSQPFPSYMPFWDKCTEWPQMTLNTKRSKVPYIVKPALKTTFIQRPLAYKDHILQVPGVYFIHFFEPAYKDHLSIYIWFAPRVVFI